MFPTLRRTPSQVRYAEHLIGMLDDLSERARIVRSEAARLEDEKATITRLLNKFTSADELMHCEHTDKGDLLAQKAHIEELLSNVNVSVGVTRTPSQQEALDAALKALSVVEQQIDAAEAAADAMPDDAVSAYVNSTSPDPAGPIDEKFQSAVLACTLDDQKSIRRRAAELKNRLSDQNVRILKMSEDEKNAKRALRARLMAQNTTAPQATQTGASASFSVSQLNGEAAAERRASDTMPLEASDPSPKSSHIECGHKQKTPQLQPQHAPAVSLRGHARTEADVSSQGNTASERDASAARMKAGFSYDPFTFGATHSPVTAPVKSEIKADRGKKMHSHDRRTPQPQAEGYRRIPAASSSAPFSRRIPAPASAAPYGGDTYDDLFGPTEYAAPVGSRRVPPPRVPNNRGMSDFNSIFGRNPYASGFY